MGNTRESCTARKNIIDATFNKEVDRKTSERALAVIVWSLGDKPLRAIQNCESDIEAWEKLSSRYASKSLINRLILINNVLDMKLKNDVQIGDHVAQLKSQFSRLAAMDSAVEEQMQVAT